MKEYFIFGTIIFVLSFNYWPKIESFFQDEQLPQIEKNVIASEKPIVNSSHQILHIPILIYHSVQFSYPNETAEQKRFSVTPELFEQQLAYLQDHGYTTISLDQMIDGLKRGTTSPITKPVVITFDDGWGNQYDQAFPLLKKYHATATFYVFTNPIGKDSRFLTWDELKELADAGMTIGSHSVFHPYFDKTISEKLRKEIFDSKKTLEEKLGRPITHFATPFGYSDEQIEKLIIEAGYSSNRTTKGSSNYSSAEIFHLPGFFAPHDMHNFVWLLDFAK